MVLIISAGLLGVPSRLDIFRLVGAAASAGMATAETSPLKLAMIVYFLAVFICLDYSPISLRGKL